MTVPFNPALGSVWAEVRFGPGISRNELKGFVGADARASGRQAQRNREATRTARWCAHRADDAGLLQCVWWVGTDDKHIATVDGDGVALAAIQGLNQKLEETRAELKRREAENSELRTRLEKIEALPAHKLN